MHERDHKPFSLDSLHEGAERLRLSLVQSPLLINIKNPYSPPPPHPSEAVLVPCSIFVGMAGVVPRI